MFREFFRFELFYWLRGWMIYIFIGVITFLFGFAAGSDFVQVGGPVGNAHKNAPYIIALWYAAASVLTCFMATAVYDSSASRDFSSKMSDILFSKPLNKWGFLWGRFSAATLIAALPALGISLGVLLARWYHWSDTERWGPIHLWDHVLPNLVFTIPNTLLFGAVVFAIATVTRNTLYSFLGVLLLLVGYAVAQGITGRLDYETLNCLIDPFGAAPFEVATKYWTVDERNTKSIPMTPLLLINRIIWLSVSLLVFGIAGRFFTFETRSQGRRKKREAIAPAVEPLLEPSLLIHTTSIPKRTPQISWVSQLASSLRSDLASVVFSTTFIVIMSFAILNTMASLFLGGNAESMFGNSTFPVTYKMVESIQGSYLAFVIAIIAFFTGVLVWRDRDCHLHEIVGATPSSNSVFVASRLITMIVTIQTLLLLGIAMGCFYQLTQGYTRFQLGVYFQELIVIQGTRFLFLIVLGLLAHTLAPNKYVGYANFVLFIIVNAFIWQGLRWETLLVRFGAMPRHIYSDMFGIAPFSPGLIAFGVYWSLVSCFLLWICTVAMHRGVALKLRSRLIQGFRSQPIVSAGFAMLALAAAGGMGGWLYYNTQVLNTLVGAPELDRRQVAYEQTYETIASIDQPKIQSVKYTIDIFPETRNMILRAEQTIANKSAAPIETLYVNLAPGFDTTVEIPGTTLNKDDERLHMRTYRLDPPLQPGRTLEMKYVVASKTRGIENQVSQTMLVQNGTFFNNGIAPSFGFDPNRRLILPKRRKDFGLGPIETVPELTRECSHACSTHYIAQDSDWVSIETVISTSADQTAIAPGSLVEQWSDKGRNYYRYRVDHPSLNFYSFISARYDVMRSKVGGVDTEVYYHPEHRWNVTKMSDAIADTLDYCTTHFGPYKHHQARIIEFPRVSSFAQAFPGTMPYSESIGFIANLEKPDDIDKVTYIVAHEMAHQWWAHQVIGARMKGSTLLSETMAQYTALMVMRRKYGDDMMHKFLRYEMDRYLRSRGAEEMKERPLINVEPNQGYIHYQKGSVALYYLAEMIGEDRINSALKDVIEKFAYQGPPYPNAHVLVDRLKEQTPPELQYLIKDLFEDITLFGNRTVEASAMKQDDGKYRVKLIVECEKFKADATGHETSVEMNDWIEVGAFAKPDPDKRYGKLLFRERKQLSAGKHELEFVTDEIPYQAGIDPRNMLIDRVPTDNLKNVTVKSGSAL